jgi:hypothetical protein
MRKHALVAAAFFVVALAAFGCSEAPAPSSSAAPPAPTPAAVTDTTQH